MTGRRRRTRTALAVLSITCWVGAIVLVAWPLTTSVHGDASNAQARESCRPVPVALFDDEDANEYGESYTSTCAEQARERLVPAVVMLGLGAAGAAFALRRTS